MFKAKGLTSEQQYALQHGFLIKNSAA